MTRYRDQPTTRGWRCRHCGKRTTYTRPVTHLEARRLWWVHTGECEAEPRRYPHLTYW